MEIIFVSSDRTAQEMVAYVAESHGDWLSLDYYPSEGTVSGTVKLFRAQIYRVMFVPPGYSADIRDHANHLMTGHHWIHRLSLICDCAETSGVELLELWR